MPFYLTPSRIELHAMEAGVEGAKRHKKRKLYARRLAGGVSKKSLTASASEASSPEHQQCDYLVFSFNVTPFTPNELKITLEGRTVVIRGDHEPTDCEDGGSFCRRFQLPKALAVSDITTTLEDGGRLVVEVKKNRSNPTSDPDHLASECESPEKCLN